jgi:hypothetical protein
MQEIKIKIEWNKDRKQYDMSLAETGDHIQEFFACKNFRAFFKGANKTGIHFYTLKAEREG